MVVGHVENIRGLNITLNIWLHYKIRPGKTRDLPAKLGPFNIDSVPDYVVGRLTSRC